MSTGRGGVADGRGCPGVCAHVLAAAGAGTRVLAMIAASWSVLAASYAGATVLRSSVMGNGATPTSGVLEANHALRGTLGEAAVGTSSNSSFRVQVGYWSATQASVVSVDDPAHRVPERLSFGPPQPNPASDNVRFTLAMPKGDRVDLCIYDVRGRRVATLVSGEMPAGYHDVQWTGGALTGSGVYFARLWIGNRQAVTRRFVVRR